MYFFKLIIIMWCCVFLLFENKIKYCFFILKKKNQYVIICNFEIRSFDLNFEYIMYKKL